jgi:hypothetical protein
VQWGDFVATFIVDRVMPGLTPELLVEAQRLLHEASRRFSTEAETVRYLRCTFLADEQRCICLFEAPSADAVRRVNDMAQVPFRRVQPGAEFSAPGRTAAPAGSQGRERREI